MAEVKIDCAQISRADSNNLSRDLIAAIERAFEIPEIQQRFEEWQRKYRMVNTGGKIPCLK